MNQIIVLLHLLLHQPVLVLPVPLHTEHWGA